MNIKYSIRKVFTSFDMPHNIRELISNYRDIHCNDMYIAWNTCEEWLDPEQYEQSENKEINSTRVYDGQTYVTVKGNNLIDDWLLENGVSPDEEIVIHYCW